MKILNKLSLLSMSLFALSGTTIAGLSKGVSNVNAEGESTSTTKYMRVQYTPKSFVGEYALGYFESSDSVKIWNGKAENNNFIDSTFSENIFESDSQIVTLSFNSADSETYSIKVNGGDNDGKYLTVSNTEIGFSDIEASFVLTAKYENIGIQYSGETKNKV
ncbi:MAG TPA: hypothetical protein DD377_00280, partial [Firmicutes bacterium]|nr:hypothetical protein [Bacillota bacterium]